MNKYSLEELAFIMSNEGANVALSEEMPHVSKEFIEWFVLVMREVQTHDYDQINATKQAYNAGRNSVLMSLIRMKQIEQGE